MNPFEIFSQAVKTYLNNLLSHQYFSQLHGKDWTHSRHHMLGDRFTRQAQVGRIGIVAVIMIDPRALINPEHLDSYVMKVNIVFKGRVLKTNYYMNDRVKDLNPTKVRSFNRLFDQVCNIALTEHRKIL